MNYYLLFANVNVRQYVNRTPIRSDMTMLFPCSVLLVRWEIIQSANYG
ncbi:hypothetical protein NDS46_12345 [Paenibacillus thiaminolyticus]|nr:hypothetical protein [Paenibacillus thiaminolyticus]WCF10578.1 hypothetical protein NDS46_12345 [Paenibacillus thiaminolyticus]